MQGFQNADFKAAYGKAASVLEDDDVLFRNIAAKGNILCGFASVDFCAAFVGNIGRIHDVVMMRMGNENSPEPVDPMQPDQPVT